MATECGVTDFMAQQDKEASKKFDIKRLEECSNQINEAFDSLKTPTGTQAQQTTFFRNKPRVLLSGSSDFLKSREFKSSKSRNAELNKLTGNTHEDLDDSNISMISVTTNKNEQAPNVNFTD